MTALASLGCQALINRFGTSMHRGLDKLLTTLANQTNYMVLGLI